MVAHKLVILSAVVILLNLRPNHFNLDNFNHNFHWPESQAMTNWGRIFKTWDAQHYLYLSAEGYSPQGPSNNFFPLWPLLMRAGSGLIGGNLLLSGVLLSNVFSLAAAALFYLMIEERHGEKIARTSILLLLAYPGALFLSFAYSESIFFLLCMLLFLSLDRGRLIWAALAGFLLPLARPQGLLCAAPIWYALIKKPVDKRGCLDWLLAAAPLAGFAAYLAFMRAHTGDAWSGFNTFREDYPFAPSAVKLLDLPGLVSSLLRVSGFHGHTGSFLDRFWFLLLWPCLAALWRTDRLLFFYALPMGLVPAAALSFVSYTRHFLLVFPVFLVIGKVLCRQDKVLARRLVLAALAALQAVLLFRHINNDWSG